MSNLDNVNSAFSVTVYKKLQKQIDPLAEKLVQLEENTRLIKTTPGPKGDQGIKGDRGIPGRDGERGLIGEQGLQGIQGIQGEKGDIGLKGDVGPQGIQGEKGDTGPQGIQGERGLIGEQGLQGIQGEKGEKGDTGPQGIQGLKGDIGPQGIQGIPGKDGKIGPQGIQGKQGIPGIKGDIGEKGADGKAGPQGIQGNTGPQGEIGPKGEDGKDAILPDIDKIIEPHLVEVKKEIDSYIIKSDKDFNNYRTIINKSISNMAGGGVVKLKNLVDVQTSTAKVDGKFLKYDASQNKWVGGSVDISSIVGGAPEALDTLNELAEALNDDENFATTVTNSIATKAPLASPSFTGNASFGGNIALTAGADSQINLQGDTIIDFGGDFSIDGGGILSFGGTEVFSAEERLLLQPDGFTALSWGNSGVSISSLSVTNMLSVPGDIEAEGAEFGMSGGSVTFHGVTEFQDEVDFSSGSLIGLTDLTVDTNVLSVNGTSNKVGIRHIPTISSAVLHVNGDVTVEDGGEKSLEIITGAYSYKLGDIDSGESGSHLEIAAPDANFIFNNGKVGINKTPSSGIDLDVNGDTTISGTLTCNGAIIATSDIQFESTIDLVGGSGISATDKIETTGIVKAQGYSLKSTSFTTISTSSTLASSTNGLTVILQNTGPITITLPTLTAGHVTTFITETINAVSFVNDTGVTVNSFNGANTTAGQFAQCQVIYKTSTVAFLGGNIV